MIIATLIAMELTRVPMPFLAPIYRVPMPQLKPPAPINLKPIQLKSITITPIVTAPTTTKNKQ